MNNDIPNMHERLGQQLERYCRQYAIPIEFFFEIINDQKVLPMLRGKGMEYNVYLQLRQLLEVSAWEVTKLNLGASPGILDEDISITHRRTGIRLIVESKTAVRGSITDGTRSRHHRVPHFNVKCHRSRSFIGRTGNDRYQVSDFDVLVTNPSNALFAGGTIGEELEIINDPGLLELLYNYYGVRDNAALLQAATDDWRFAIPSDIADERGLIPRTPVVYLENDPHWQRLSDLQSRVEEVVRQRIANRRSRRNS